MRHAAVSATAPKPRKKTRAGRIGLGGYRNRPRARGRRSRASLSPMQLGRAIAVGLIAGACSACGNDFDALFAGDAPDASATDGAPSTGGDAGDAGADATRPTCTANASCPAPSSCPGGTCDFACACGCDCPKFSCPGSSKSCRTTCDVGAKCDVSCGVDETCELASHGADAKFTCKEDVNLCSVVCDSGGACDVTCDSEGPCSVACAAGTECALKCTGRPKLCELTCQGGGIKKDCGAGVYTCNRACPG